MNALKLVIAVLCLALVACEEQASMAVGQLESDRVELVAEYGEPIIAIAVREGDSLVAGDLVLAQDSSRSELQIAEAEANRQRLLALLTEQENGPRPETVAVVAATLQEARIERDYRARELTRLDRLRVRDLTSQESVDNAQRLLDAANAKIAYVQAQLAELDAGTRVEQIEQTRNQVRQVEAQLASLRLNRERLLITAPVAGIVDSLPFEVGERPRIGDVVAVLLGGTQPHARVYIPEAQRAQVSVGTRLAVSVDGLEETLTGTVRRIANEPTFTPYYALTERDRGRLSYVAEIELPASPRRLPDGVPVQILFEQD